MQQPKSIERFEQLFFLSCIIGIALVLLGWNKSIESLQQNPVIAQAAPAILIGTTVVMYGVWVLLWYLIARRGSEVAKWFYVVLLALEVVTTIAGVLLLRMVPNAPEVDPLNRAGAILSLLLGIASAWFLFRPDTRAWFNRGVDPNA